MLDGAGNRNGVNTRTVGLHESEGIVRGPIRPLPKPRSLHVGTSILLRIPHPFYRANARYSQSRGSLSRKIGVFL